MTRAFTPVVLVLAAFILCIPFTARAKESRFEASGTLGRRAALTIASAPIVAMQPSRIALKVLDNGGKSIPARGNCDLTMPAMPMPENRPALNPIGDSLVGEAIFTMAGEWRATCTIEYSDSRKESFVFNLGDVQL